MQRGGHVVCGQFQGGTRVVCGQAGTQRGGVCCVWAVQGGDGMSAPSEAWRPCTRTPTEQQQQLQQCVHPAVAAAVALAAMMY